MSIFLLLRINFMFYNGIMIFVIINHYHCCIATEFLYIQMFFISAIQ